MTKGVEFRITEINVADSLSIGHGNIGVRASGLIIERAKTDSHIVCDISDPVCCVCVLVYICVHEYCECVMYVLKGLPQKFRVQQSSCSFWSKIKARL